MENSTRTIKAKVSVSHGFWFTFKSAATGLTIAAILVAIAVAAAGGGEGRWKDEKSMIPTPGIHPGEIGVCLIRMTGEITSDMAGGDVTPTMMERLFAEAEKNPSVEAVLMEMETPGGDAAASDLIHHLIRSFRERTGKPVLVHAGTLLASGGFYAAMAADKTYMAPYANGGSIGVIVSMWDASKTLDKAGARKETFRSGPLKGMGDWSRPMTQAERDKAGAMVSGFKKRFVEVVAEGRGMTAETVGKFATGEVWTGEKLASLGLIDGTAYLDEMGDHVRATLGKTGKVFYLETAARKTLADRMADAGKRMADKVSPSFLAGQSVSF